MANDDDHTDDRDLRAANLSDIRRIMGGLFLLYGITSPCSGLGASDEDLKRADGVNVNLLVGIVLPSWPPPSSPGAVAAAGREPQRAAERAD